MTRKTKISCDVTRDADNMLKAYCIKHERSKGYLIEKMIRKYCAEIEVTPAVVKTPKAPVKRFVPPTKLQVTDYMFEKTNSVHFDEPNRFIDFYESNGWKVGKNKMKCWKASVRNWLKTSNRKQQGKTSGNQSACEDFING